MIKGLKFSAVSSRNGGYFHFEFSLRSPAGLKIDPVLSCKIRVLSERLKNEVKARSVLDLTSVDKLLRVPGIGKKYAKKLAERGFRTVGDLSSVMERDSPQSIRKRHLLIDAVRDDKGSLTEGKLKDILREARAVVQREGQNANPSSSNMKAASFPESGPYSSAPSTDSSRQFESFGMSFFNADFTEYGDESAAQNSSSVYRHETSFYDAEEDEDQCLDF